MPFYDVEHITPLTSAQRNALAKAITRIHSETFTTPKLFVNVRFVDLRQRKGEVLFVAGKEKVCLGRVCMCGVLVMFGGCVWVMVFADGRVRCG